MASKVALLSVSLYLLSHFHSPPAPEVLSPPPGNSLLGEAAVPLPLLVWGIRAVWAAAWIPDSSVGDPSSRDRQLGLRVSASPRRGSLHRRDRQWGPPSFRIPRVELALAVPRRPLAECTSGATGAAGGGVFGGLVYIVHRFVWSGFVWAALVFGCFPRSLFFFYSR